MRKNIISIFFEKKRAFTKKNFNPACEFCVELGNSSGMGRTMTINKPLL